MSTVDRLLCLCDELANRHHLKILRADVESAMDWLKARETLQSEITHVIDEIKADAERIENIGARMANICFNLGQNEDTKLDADARRVMRQCQREWDARRNDGKL